MPSVYYRTGMIMLLTAWSAGLSAQFLSRLTATRNDALFTTYAAPPERSDYKNDQGYQLQWFDNSSGVEFISKEGPCFGLAFSTDKRLVFRLNELYREPVIMASYSDLVKLHYYPLRDVRVGVFFAVYSSATAFAAYTITNEGHFPVTLSALPYLYMPSSDSLQDMIHPKGPGAWNFPLVKRRDGWMVEHTIPVADTLTGSWTLTGSPTLTGSAFVKRTGNPFFTEGEAWYKDLLRSWTENKRASKFVKGIIHMGELTLKPGESTTFTLAVSLAGPVPALPEPDLLVRADEKAYDRIPEPRSMDRDQEMLYWSAFSLMRQCMMPPEGECMHNYYVFSREPRWGWGYGGQVFHESLVMMAYAYMDPEGAMNSQRVFMDRQRPDGYINYRTGPYLNETIETNGKPTSSAPWFNYQNLEIYKISGDRKFLAEAYASGKKFYRYYVANRDSNSNGLCEWGAHAELESVRDARVAVWDKVGWASNFEGPDINSMLVMEARALGEMASILGKAGESSEWKADAVRRAAMINRCLWDPETKFYYNVNKNDGSFTFHSPGDLKIKEIIGFLPLWAGVADRDMAALLVEKMQDTAEFWRPFGVPSLTAVSDYYCPIGYWNGPVWVQWDYLVYRGLRDYGYHELAGQVASKVLDNMSYHLKKDHVFWEFYSADDRQAGWNKTYIWAGIAARFLIDKGKTKNIRP